MSKIVRLTNAVLKTLISVVTDFVIFAATYIITAAWSPVVALKFSETNWFGTWAIAHVVATGFGISLVIFCVMYICGWNDD